jgi:hypothetical protein
MVFIIIWGIRNPTIWDLISFFASETWFLMRTYDLLVELRYILLKVFLILFVFKKPMIFPANIASTWHIWSIVCLRDRSGYLVIHIIIDHVRFLKAIDLFNIQLGICLPPWCIYRLDIFLMNLKILSWQLVDT